MRQNDGSGRNTNKQTEQKTLTLTLSVGGPQPLAASGTRRGPGDREEGGWRMLGVTGGGTDGRRLDGLPGERRRRRA